MKKIAGKKHTFEQINMNILRNQTMKAFVALLVLVISTFSIKAEILFNNLGTPIGMFNSGAGVGVAGQIGDEVILSSPLGATLTSFSFEYYGSNFVTSAEQARVLLYKNDGAAVPSGQASPGTVIWDSGFFNIVDTFNETLGTNALVTIGTDDLGGGLLVPSHFTWSVVFTGLGAGSSAGLIFSTAAPAIGFGYNDYWVNTGTIEAPNWVLQVNSGYNVDFLSQFNGVQVVPEPTVPTLLLLGMLMIVAWHFMRSRTRQSK